MLAAALLAIAAAPAPAAPAQRADDVASIVLSVCPEVNAGRLDITTPGGRASLADLAIVDRQPPAPAGRWEGSMRGDLTLRADRAGPEAGASAKCGVVVTGPDALSIREGLSARLTRAGWTDSGAADEVARYVTFLASPASDKTSIMIVTLPDRSRKKRHLVSFTLLDRR